MENPDLVCPRDASPLAVREWGPSWFGSCGPCHGVWIRPEELHRFSQQLASPPASSSASWRRNLRRRGPY